MGVVSIAYQVLEYQQWRSYYLLVLGLQARLGYEQIQARRRAIQAPRAFGTAAERNTMADNGREWHS